MDVSFYCIFNSFYLEIAFRFRNSQKLKLRNSIKNTLAKINMIDKEKSIEYENRLETKEQCLAFLTNQGYIVTENETNLIDLWCLYCRQYEELSLIPAEINRFIKNMQLYSLTLGSKLIGISNSSLYWFIKTKINYFDKIIEVAKLFQNDANREITLLLLNLNGSTPYCHNSRFRKNQPNF